MKKTRGNMGKNLIRIFFILSSLISLASCNSIPKLENRIIITADTINRNKIGTLNINNKLDLSNDEINTYYINKMYLKNVAKLIMDFKPSKGKIDNLFVNDVIGEKTLLLDLNIIGDKKTIIKDIPFLVTKNRLDIKLYKDLIFDNTAFEIKEVKRGGYIFYALKPYFLDELSFTIKSNNVVENKKEESSEYKENLIVSMEKINKINKNSYIENLSVISEGQILEGKAIPNSMLEISYSGNKIYTRVDKNGNYKTIVPISKGEITVRQLMEE